LIRIVSKLENTVLLAELPFLPISWTALFSQAYFDEDLKE